MNVETKFNLDQELYFLDEKTQKIACEKSHRCDIEVEDGKITIKYWFKPNNNYQIVNEIRVFASRQELIDSL